MTTRTDIDSDRLVAALDARVDRREQRRAFFRDALGAMAVTGALGLASNAHAQATPTPTATPTYTDVDILNFALNLEYLEAQFYAYATSGSGIASSLLGGSGTPGSVNATGATAVPFADPIIARYAREIAADEVAHVTFLRNALGASSVVAQPALDLSVGPNSAFSAAAVAAKIINAGQTFNPYANEDAFLLAAFIFEDVGVTAYKGAAPLLTKTYIEAAAGIMATEAYHAATIRGELYRKGLVSGSPLIAQVQGISDARDSLDGGTDSGGNGRDDLRQFLPDLLHDLRHRLALCLVVLGVGLGLILQDLAQPLDRLDDAVEALDLGGIGFGLSLLRRRFWALRTSGDEGGDGHQTSGS